MDRERAIKQASRERDRAWRAREREQRALERKQQAEQEAANAPNAPAARRRRKQVVKMEQAARFHREAAEFQTRHSRESQP